MAELPLTSVQVDAILDLQLYRLTGLEIDKLEAEYAELLKLIDYLKQLLSSERMLLDLIKEELVKVSQQYEDERRTTIIEEELLDFDIEDLIKDEDFVISVTKNGYIKRTALTAYKIQGRGTMGSTYKYIMLFSRQGYVKKTSLAAFANPRSSGIIAADVREGDSLFEAQITEGDDEVILGTNLGKAIRFHEWDVREIGRTARGVIGIRMDEEDFVVGADVIREEDKYILTVTENGIGKKSELALYRIQGRGGKGLINISINERLGKVIIGTVEGDIHDIGKDLVVFMLDVSGFEVVDLGIDVPVQKFVDAIKDTGSTVVGLSGFLTLAFDSMKDTVDAIEAAGLRKNVKIMIGGGQINEEVRGFTGADAYGRDAVEAVRLAQGWIGG